LNGITFDDVIIDEAAQAVELSSIIPLKFQSKRYVLVGDPNQLPATVFSKLAANSLYEQSLFQRLMIKMPVSMLSIQYRMHPEIRLFPSLHFYNNNLRDGENITEKDYTQVIKKRREKKLIY
jgi:senataxin